ncbi:hypothetical protein KM043_016255 [Ampulex compressa]|nr:hypothetical protein KM043_016255 [Ampulex compressa]
MPWKFDEGLRWLEGQNTAAESHKVKDIHEIRKRHENRAQLDLSSDLWRELLYLRHPPHVQTTTSPGLCEAHRVELRNAAGSRCAARELANFSRSGENESEPDANATSEPRLGIVLRSGRESVEDRREMKYS